MKQIDLGISIGDGRKLAIPLNANDLAILSETPIGCKNCINEWYDRVKRKINVIKTKLIEIRKSKKKGVYDRAKSCFKMIYLLCISI